MTEFQFDDQARGEILALVEGVSWGDVSVDTITNGLKRAMYASTHAFGAWEGHGEAALGDEFSLSAEQVDALGPELRAAYIARLICDASIIWDDNGPGMVIAGLVAISHASAARRQAADKGGRLITGNVTPIGGDQPASRAEASCYSPGELEGVLGKLYAAGHIDEIELPCSLSVWIRREERIEFEADNGPLDSCGVGTVTRGDDPRPDQTPRAG
jgi:hypothetical protein